MIGVYSSRYSAKEDDIIPKILQYCMLCLTLAANVDTAGVKRAFLQNIILLLAINFLVKPLYLFGVDAHIQNMVGPREYGVYLALFGLVFMFQFIIEPGIQSYNSQNIAKNPDQLGYHLPRILGIKLGLLPVFVGAVVVAFVTLGYTADLLPLLGFIILNLFLSTTFIFLRSNIAAVGMYKTDSLLSALDKLLMLVILGTASWLPGLREHFTIMWLVYGQTLAYVLSCLVAFILLRKHLGRLQLTFSWQYLVNLLKWSFPYILILLFMSIYNKSDAIMLERMLGDKGLEAGIYAAGLRFVEALNMIGYLFAALLLPMYSSNLASRQVLTELLYTGLKTLAVLAFVAMLSLIYYGVEIMPMIYTAATDYYAQVLSYLMLSFGGVAIAYLYGTLLVANGNLRPLNILLFVGAVANLLLNAYLIPIYKAEGAAIATAITQGAVMLGQVYLVHKLTKVEIAPKIYGRVLTFGLLCALIFYGIHMAADWPWTIRWVVSTCVCIFLALILRLVDLNGLLDLVKKRPTTE